MCIDIASIISSLSRSVDNISYGELWNTETPSGAICYHKHKLYSLPNLQRMLCFDTLITLFLNSSLAILHTLVIFPSNTYYYKYFCNLFLRQYDYEVTWMKSWLFCSLFQIGENFNYSDRSFWWKPHLQGEAVCFMGLVSEGNCTGKLILLRFLRSIQP
jgi:hypothetical protein